MPEEKTIDETFAVDGAKHVADLSAASPGALLGAIDEQAMPRRRGRGTHGATRRVRVTPMQMWIALQAMYGNQGYFEYSTTAARRIKDGVVELSVPNEGVGMGSRREVIQLPANYVVVGYQSSTAKTGDGAGA